ncbi:MAG TPA: YaeQ family protein [Thermoanaerobaculia bacterium]|nr:YaeQ family protein [Thermoanaerobaculia bacterium]
MALTSTMFNVTADLSDVDRGVYEQLDLRVAMHPSESAEYMATRLLAYCLEYTEGIEFTSGLSDGDEPAVIVRDLTGRVRGWIEVGMPDADRLHRAAKLADRVAVYTHREIRNVLGQLERRKIHRGEEIPIFTFGRGFIEEVAAHLERRIALSLSITERHLYLDVNGRSLATVVEEHHIGG